jgi:two-component system sensor histidine kinase BaeS
VTDTGIGIPVEAQPFIFDRFFRVDKARNRMDGGSGLGLSIVKSIAVAHGGRISVYSSPGQGSTFTVLLPIGGPPGCCSDPAIID